MLPDNLTTLMSDTIETTEERLDLYIEALIFAAQYALNVQEVTKVLNETFGQIFDKNDVEAQIQSIIDKYNDDNYAIQLVAIASI